MRRFALFLSMSALVIASACSDRATSPISPTSRNSIERPATEACVVLSDAAILDLIDDAYVNGSPDEQAALGKWDNITKQRAAAREDLVKEKVLDLVDFTLEKNTQGKLSATDEQLKALINALFCYAGLSEYYYPGGGGDLIYPTDQAKVVYEKDGFAAMSLPPNAVLSPTLVTITRTSTQLNTPLDKYPANFEFSKYPADEPFAKFVITEVCAVVNDPDPIRAQNTFDALVLGHNKSNGQFELLPKPAGYASVLTRCSELVASATPSLGERLLAYVLPKQLYAAAMFGGGGVAGSVIELSPIGPVDPRINVVKVGGNSTAPIGALVDPAPGVRLVTPNGNGLDGIAVNFAAATGSGLAVDGVVTPGSVTTATVVENQVSLVGLANTTWKLGINTTPSAYQMTATPQTGGDVAVTGVDFQPDLQTFTATALNPTSLLVSAPANGTAGTTLATTTATLRVSDQTAAGYLGEVEVTGPSGIGLSGTTRRPVVNGVATFDNLVITKSGTHTLTFTATSTAGQGTYSSLASITIAKAAPRITIVSTTPDTVNVQVLNTAPAQPRVRVADVHGNLYDGITVYWRTYGGSSVTPASTTTGSDGTSANSWMLVEGPNVMQVALDDPASENPQRFVDFNTFYKLPRQSTTLLACALGNNRADLAPHAFRFTTLPGNNRNPARIDEMKIFLSVTGFASVTRVYPLRLIAEEVANGVVTRSDTAFATALLKGNASQDAPANFVFPGGYRPTASSTVQLRVEKVPVNGSVQEGTLRFNEGSCRSTQLVPFRVDGTRAAPAIAYQITTTN